MIKIDLKQRKREVLGVIAILFVIVTGMSIYKYASFSSGFEITDDLGGNIFPSAILSVATTDAQVIEPSDSFYIGNPKSCIAIRVKSRSAYSRVRIEVAETPFFSRSVSEFILEKPHREYTIYPDIIWNYEALKNNVQAEPVSVAVTVEMNGDDLGQRVRTFSVRSINECLLGYVTNGTKFHDTGIFFAAYVTDKRMNNRPRTVREAGTGMTKDFVESFLCNDGKPIALSNLYKGDAKFMDEFENRDPRLKQCVYTPDRPIAILADGSEEYENSPVFNNLTFTGYRLYKMYSPLAEDNEYIKCTLDDLIYRYGEVLLNYAEAKAELGECDQTVLDKTINKLRDRVGMKHLTVNVGFTDPNWPKWEVAISPLLNEIRRERRVELACEGLRWNDLCRWKAGKLLENQKTYLGPRDPATGEYRVLYPGMTRTWYDRLYLYPIPTDEFTYNPNLLPQNPGWAN